MMNLLLLVFCSVSSVCISQEIEAEEKLRIIAIGAHPDDCDIKMGGTEKPRPILHDRGFTTSTLRAMGYSGLAISAFT